MSAFCVQKSHSSQVTKVISVDIDNKWKAYSAYSSEPSYRRGCCNRPCVSLQAEQATQSLRHICVNAIHVDTYCISIYIWTCTHTCTMKLSKSFENKYEIVPDTPNIQDYSTFIHFFLRKNIRFAAAYFSPTKASRHITSLKRGRQFQINMESGWDLKSIAPLVHCSGLVAHSVLRWVCQAINSDSSELRTLLKSILLFRHDLKLE